MGGLRELVDSRYAYAKEQENQLMYQKIVSMHFMWHLLELSAHYSCVLKRKTSLFDVLALDTYEQGEITPSIKETSSLSQPLAIFFS